MLWLKRVLFARKFAVRMPKCQRHRFTEHLEQLNALNVCVKLPVHRSRPASLTRKIGNYFWPLCISDGEGSSSTTQQVLGKREKLLPTASIKPPPGPPGKHLQSVTNVSIFSIYMRIDQIHKLQIASIFIGRPQVKGVCTRSLRCFGCAARKCAAIERQAIHQAIH